MGFLSPVGSTLVYSKVLTADTTTIDTGAGAIPGGGKVLSVYATLRCDQAVVSSSGLITFNADGGSNYDSVDVQVQNATVSGSNALAQAGIVFNLAGDSAPAGVVSSLQLAVPSYAATMFNSTGQYTTVLPSQVAASIVLITRGFAWRSTAAINQVTLAITTGSGQKFKAGSAIYVYVQ